MVCPLLRLGQLDWLPCPPGWVRGRWWPPYTTPRDPRDFAVHSGLTARNRQTRSPLSTVDGRPLPPTPDSPTSGAVEQGAGSGPAPPRLSPCTSRRPEPCLLPRTYCCWSTSSGLFASACPQSQSMLWGRASISSWVPNKASLLPLLLSVRDGPQLARLVLAQAPNFGSDPVAVT